MARAKKMTLEPQQNRQRLLDDLPQIIKDFRNIRGELCKLCSGWGVITYGSTATWRGGIGGQMMTSDVCKKCWGSGDAAAPWPDRRLTK